MLGGADQTRLEKANRTATQQIGISGFNGLKQGSVRHRILGANMHIGNSRSP